MKKIIAIAAVFASTSAFAFFENGSNAFVQDGRGQAVGNGQAEGEANFSMSFTGRGKTKGDFIGQAENGMNNRAYGYENPYYSFPAEDK